MDDLKILEKQENLFYEKLTKYEKEYLESFNKHNENHNNYNNSNNKLKEIQDIIMEIIKTENKDSSIFNLNNNSNEYNERKVYVNNLMKKIKKLSKEEGGFLIMPFRIILYNFLYNYESFIAGKTDTGKIQKNYNIQNLTGKKTYGNENYENLSTQTSLNCEDIKFKRVENKENIIKANADEEAICGLIHNDCYRSIINKFFEFYKLNENEADETHPLFINKDNLIELFKKDILDYLNHNSIYLHNKKGFNDNNNPSQIKYKFKYYQGMNDLIIFFILMEKISQADLDKYKLNKNKNEKSFELNDEIISYLEKSQQNSNKSCKKEDLIKVNFNLHNFLDFVFHRNFEPFCFEKINCKNNQNAFNNSKHSIELVNKHNKESINGLKMKKILPTVIKYIEIINPKIKRRLFDLTKIDPFYSLGWILTWFTHNNENIFKNFRMIDYLLFNGINTIFYLVAVIIIEEYKKLEADFLEEFNFPANYSKKFYLMKSSYENAKDQGEESFLFNENYDIVNFILIFIFQRKS